MARMIVRTMEAYSVHGHLRPGTQEEGLLDYVEFFDALARTSPHDLRFQIGNDTVAITDVSERGEQLAFRFVTGNSDELPLVYDRNTATAQEVDPGEDRFVVNGAWVVVEPTARISVIERKRPGVPQFQIERFLEKFGQKRLGLADLTVSLNPVPSASFTEEIAQFTRIREASITLRRPNQSWTKNAEAMLGELAESNASEVQLRLNAERGQSLSKSRGVVQEVIDLARKPINALKNVVIKGQTPAFEGERSVSLRKHAVKGTARIDPSDGPIKQLDPLSDLADTLIRQALQSGAGQEELNS